MTDTVVPGPATTPGTAERMAVLPPINGTGGAGTGAWGRAERMVYLTWELEEAARALGELQ